MANYSLVVNSKFQPFSFERYIQPYQIYGQAYREVENQYNDLSTKANVWEEMANEQTDPYAYKMYKTFANDLEEKAGQLAREGLNAKSWREMFNMRARYSKEITPIEQAYTARQKQAEQQQQALLQDPTLMISRVASNTSLDDYIRNPQLGYESYSGKMLTAQVAQAVTALSKDIRNNPRKWDSILNGQYFETRMKKGYTPEEIILSIANDPSAPKELVNIVEDVIGSSKIASWGDKSILDRAYYYARQGLWSGVGETQYQTIQNQNYMSPLQRLQYKQALRQEEEIKNRYRVNPLPLRSTQEISKSNKEIQYFIDKGYLMRNNNGLVLTKRGLQELNSSNFKIPTLSWEDYKKKNPGASKSSYDSMVAQIERMGNKPNYFSTWYNKNIGGYNSLTKTVSTPTTRLNKYKKSIQEDSYDVYHTTEYDRQLDESYGKEYLTQMFSNAKTKDGEKVLEEVEFKGKEGWVPTGRYLTKKDLYGYRATNSRPSVHGNTVILQSDKEDGTEIIRVRRPIADKTNEDNLRSAVLNVNYFDDILRKGKQPKLDNNGNLLIDSNGNVVYSNTPLTNADRIVFNRKKEEAMQDVSAYDSQIIVPSETGNEQIKPWY